MYLPLEYVKRYSVLTELYCSEEYINCEPEVLLEMIADADWGTSNYSGPNKERYIVSAKYCYAAHESRLHQNDRCKRFALCLVLTVRFRSLAPWGKLFQLFI